MSDDPRLTLSPQASAILRTIGERDEVVLIPENEELMYRKAEKVYEVMWSGLVAPCIEAQGLAPESWIDYLFMIGPQEEGPHSIDDDYLRSTKELGVWLAQKGIDTARLSHELTTAYSATAAALLPRYRQRQLECAFDLQVGNIVLGPEADYSPMGQKAFFILVQRLLLQRLLSQRGIRFPIFITRYLDCLDADWSFAIWRLIISATGPVVAIDPGPRLYGDMRNLLHSIDWAYPTDFPHFGILESGGTLDLEPLGEPTRAWLMDPPHNRQIADVPAFMKKYPD